MLALFWISTALVAYTYLLYPALIAALARIAPRPVRADPNHTPSVTLVVAAFNEARILEEKIRNVLALDYPGDRIECLFGSDGSTDATNEILQACRAPNVRVFLYPEREGKLSVLNKLVSQARGDILLFSDANTMVEPDAVRKLMSHFADPEVGGVCGRLRLVPAGETPGSRGESAYWRYESAIKQAEGAVKTVVGANGAIYAVRRELFRPLPAHAPLADDFLIPLRALEGSERVTYEAQALATEITSPDMRGEFARKLRIATANFSALSHILPFLNPLRGFVAWALWSHKVVRWAVPFLALLALVANLLVLQRAPLYTLLLALQIALYAAALAGFLGDRFLGRAGILLPFYYYGMVNVALALGFWRSLMGNYEVAWQRVERGSRAGVAHAPSDLEGRPEAQPVNPSTGPAPDGRRASERHVQN